MATLPAEMTFPDITILTIGGEPATPADVDLFNQHFCHSSVAIILWDLPSALRCVGISYHTATRVEDNKLAIGYSLQDKEVLLLDECGAEVPAGEIGDTALRAAISRWAIGETPSARRPHSGPIPKTALREYRTGDLGVIAKNGCLTHVGRHDFLMKIRGYRVDPEEIEGALRALDGVSDAVVVGRENAVGEKQLIAYYVPTASAAITVTKIRNDLARVIPDFMIQTHSYVSMRSHTLRTERWTVLTCLRHLVNGRIWMCHTLRP